MPKISIIIPVFNAAPWLLRCLDSIKQQTFSDFEVICVNDGSRDDSLKIIKNYAQSDSRFSCISFSINRGVSIARNIGITAASGEYISFIDPDDAIETNFYEKLYYSAISENFDIAKGSRLRITNNGNIDLEFINDKIKKDIYSFTWQFTTAIYKKTFLDTYAIKFPPLITNAEDVVFLWKVISNKPTITFADDVHYLYYRRQNSANSAFFDSSQYLSLLKAWKEIFLYIESKHMEISRIKITLKTFILNMAISYFRVIENDKKTSQSNYRLYCTSIIKNFGFDDIEIYYKHIFNSMLLSKNILEFNYNRRKTENGNNIFQDIRKKILSKKK